MNSRFIFDNEYLKTFDYVLGTDEAGRGPGAGPVFAACVCFTNINDNIINLLDKLNDSKQLTENMRNKLYDIIINNALWSCYQGSVEDIEKYNILRTSLNTMKKCVLDLQVKLKSNNIIVLIDGNKKIPDLNLKQEAIIKGDFKSAVISAASIVAKVERDKFMSELSKEFPEYNWSENKGYLTKKHIEAVDKYGLTKWHRKKFFEKHFEKATQLIFDL